MNRVEEHKKLWTGKHEGKEYVNMLFIELTVKNADLKKVTFRNVHFKNCYLGFNSQYYDCMFIDCKFYGKYSSLGTPAKYTNSKFENCQFIGTDLFTGQYFYNCQFSGSIKNTILSGKHSTIDNNETYFSNCDLSDLVFDNVSIYGINIFNQCRLPTKGIRLFDNTNDKLINRAEEICMQIKTQDKIESEIIFKKSLKQGQNPIILDELFLNSFFKTDESRTIFDRIVKGHELN